MRFGGVLNQRFRVCRNSEGREALNTPSKGEHEAEPPLALP